MEVTYYRIIDPKTGFRRKISIHNPNGTVRDLMEEAARQFRISKNFNLTYMTERLNPKAILKALNIDTSIYPIYLVHHEHTVDDIDFFNNIEKKRENGEMSKLRLPPILNGRESVDSIRMSSMSRQFPNPIPPLSNQTRCEYEFRGNSSSLDAHTRIIEVPATDESINRSESHSNISNSLNDEGTNLDNSERKSTFEDDRNTDNQSLLSSTESVTTSSEDTDQKNKADDEEYPSVNDILSEPLDPITPNNINSPLCNQRTETLTVRIQSLTQMYQFEILHATTMKDLVQIIWSDTSFEKESYTTNPSILLLFNHRLHIFVDSNPDELVKDFLLLRPENSTVDFYIYALPVAYNNFMYNFEAELNALFINSESWTPLYFHEHQQYERFQSIFLSSLYALRLYFRSNDESIKGIRLAMEAQFFIKLRYYLFPPAILALKHAIDGSMFWYEKSLLMDGLIQLLRHLYPERLYTEEIHFEELFYFIPILFCWLLEQCNPNDMEQDWFSIVTLINAHIDDQSYFLNPVTIDKMSDPELVLQELDETENQEYSQRHVDIRSLTAYLRQTTNHQLNLKCKCETYEIYNPLVDVSPCLDQIKRWNEEDIVCIYKTMARKYPSFTIITRGALNDEVKNQLILLSKDHTIALLICREDNPVHDQVQKRDVNHFFSVFNPLNSICQNSNIPFKIDTFCDEEELPDPRLPVFFSKHLTNQPNHVSFLHINKSRPAEQVTVVLLDLSHSMFEYSVVTSDATNKYTHIDMCKMMLGTLTDNMIPKDEIHAFGLIEFGETVQTTCPITRNREKFEQALKSHSKRGTWTYMYDALFKAIQQINSYVSSPIRAVNNCRKLIICISDGMNNAGKTTIETLKPLITKHNIVVDFISFIDDTQIKDESKILVIRKFREFCTASGGYSYSNLRLLSSIELASMFEQEAAVWLSKRSKESRGKVDKPKRYVNPIFQQSAVQQEPYNSYTQNSNNISRILSEFRSIKDYPSDDFTVFVVHNNISYWKVILKGPNQTPYENRYWMLYVEFKPNYPIDPPTVRFITPIYHININGDGKICHQIFDQGWSERTKITDVFNSIIDLLKNPNFKQPVSIQKSQFYSNNEEEYKNQAKTHARKYATSDIESLKQEHQLCEEDH